MTVLSPSSERWACTWVVSLVSASLHSWFVGPFGMTRLIRMFSGLVPTLLIVAAGLSTPACAEKRVALVIGNSAYRTVSPLDNPRNDAALMAETLSGLGFTLVGGRVQLDLDKAATDRAVQTFSDELRGADVGLFYYAGHGVQVGGTNYLGPVDANPTRETDVDFQMLDTNLVLRQMEGGGTKLNVVILDACRNNPFGGRGLRATTAGLAQMQAPERHAHFLCHAAGQRRKGWPRRPQTLHQGAGANDQATRPWHFRCVQRGRPCGDAGDRRRTEAVAILVADKGALFLRCSACLRRGGKPRAAAAR
jgi:hypothetical protein